jgi:hypothetical protein
MKFKVWVKVHPDPKWYTNALKFDSEKSAKAAAIDLWSRWMSIEEYCIRPVGIDPNES